MFKPPTLFLFVLFVFLEGATLTATLSGQQSIPTTPTAPAAPASKDAPSLAFTTAELAGYSQVIAQTTALRTQIQTALNQQNQSNQEFADKVLKAHGNPDGWVWDAGTVQFKYIAPKKEQSKEPSKADQPKK